MAIMKVADGRFLESSREVAKHYPGIKYNEVIVDNCFMQLVSKPHQFDSSRIFHLINLMLYLTNSIFDCFNSRTLDYASLSDCRTCQLQFAPHSLFAHCKETTERGILSNFFACPEVLFSMNRCAI